MAIRKYKPTSAGVRGMSVLTFDEITKTKPEKSLLVSLSKSGGRNSLEELPLDIEVAVLKENIE